MKIFETFECSGQISQILYANFETKSWFLSKFCIPPHCHERLFLCTFLAQTIYTLLKRSWFKWKFLRLSNASVKFCQIPYANFETTTRLLSKFSILLQFHERLFLCTFLAQTIYTLLKRSTLKSKFLRLSSAEVKLCQIHYVNFETKRCFLSKFCIPLQFNERFFLITFLAQTIYTLLKRSSLQWKFLRLSNARVKFCQTPYGNFETTTRFLSKFCISLQCHERLYLCTFLAQTIYTLLKRSLLQWKFFRLSSVRVKFHQIPYGNFEKTTWFLSKFCIPLQFRERLFLYTFLAQRIFTFLKRRTLKWKFLRLLRAEVKFCQIPYVNFETKSWFLSKFCTTLQFHERFFLCIFLAQKIYTLLKRSTLKWKFLRGLSAWVKFCQISYVNFETKSWFLSKFCIPLQFHERLFLCTFLAIRIYTLLKRSSLKWNFFRFSSARVKFVKFLMPILKQELYYLPNFVPLFSFMKGYSSVLF